MESPFNLQPNKSFDQKLAQFFPSAFDKIASNLECYLGYLEDDRDLVDGD